jgi:hypothetical protein
MRFKTTLIGAGCAAALTVATAGTAMAGEVTGNNKPTPIRDTANSACAFSGLDDNVPGTGQVIPGVVQNWGHTKDAPIIVSSKGASSVTIDFTGVFPGGGLVTEGCNAKLYPGK